MSQGVLGAAAPMSIGRPRRLAVAGMLGFLAGMSADLDVVIQSPVDPLLFLEYHRQFTHSLVFIPFGGWLCALALHRWYGRGRGSSFAESWRDCTLGYATHALLDACTTYGTQLFWPFSDVRIAWNTLPIVDPLYTLPILALVWWAARCQRPWLARIALLWALFYPMLGMMQRERAEAAGAALAASRGHRPLRLEAAPSFGNLLVWRIIYDAGDRYFVDAVRAGLEVQVFPGESAPKLELGRDLSWLSQDAQQARDLARFRWFAADYLAVDTADPRFVIDARFSLVPNRLDSLWGIRFDPGADSRDHVEFVTRRQLQSGQVREFWQQLRGY